MHLIVSQIEVVYRHDAHAGASTRRAYLHAQHGFTLVEMVTALVIVGVLATFAAPRFIDRNAFDSRGFHDQVASTLRYAQKAAIAQHRFVCVAFPANNKISLTQGSGSSCGGNLASPSGQPAYTISSSNATMSGYAPFYFDALGRPSASGVIAVNGYATAITVEAETGYVH